MRRFSHRSKDHLCLERLLLYFLRSSVKYPTPNAIANPGAEVNLRQVRVPPPPPPPSLPPPPRPLQPRIRWPCPHSRRRTSARPAASGGRDPEDTPRSSPCFLDDWISEYRLSPRRRLATLESETDRPDRDRKFPSRKFTRSFSLSLTRAHASYTRREFYSKNARRIL